MSGVGVSEKQENVQVVVSSGYARLDNAVLGWASTDRHRPGAVNGQPRRYCGLTIERTFEIDAEISRLEHEMKSAAANLDFERAATIRDTLKSLRTRELGLTSLQAGR